METGNSAPVKIALGIEAPVAGHDDDGAEGSEVDGELEQQRAVLLHAVKVPAVAEGVKDEVKSASLRGPGEFPIGGTKVSLLHHAAADEAFGVAILCDGELGFDSLPIRLEFGILGQFRFQGI